MIVTPLNGQKYIVWYDWKLEGWSPKYASSYGEVLAMIAEATTDVIVTEHIPLTLGKDYSGDND